MEIQACRPSTLQLLQTVHGQHYPLLIVCCLNHELFIQIRFLICNSLEQEDVQLLPAQPATCRSCSVVLNQKGHCHFPKGQGEGLQVQHEAGAELSGTLCGAVHRCGTRRLRRRTCGLSLSSCAFAASVEPGCHLGQAPAWCLGPLPAPSHCSDLS